MRGNGFRIGQSLILYASGGAMTLQVEGRETRNYPVSKGALLAFVLSSGAYAPDELKGLVAEAAGNVRISTVTDLVAALIRRSGR